jgi:hypothetical protein
VVRDEEDHGVVTQPEHVELRQQPAYPEVDHGYLAAVHGVGEIYVVPREPRFLPLAVAWVELPSLVSRSVHPSVVLGHVPGLVRVPSVHVEEEVLFVVPLQPVLGLGDRARHEPIGLGPPRRAVVGTLLWPGVVALTPNPDEVVEAAVVPVPPADEERRVHDTHRQVAGPGEEPGQGLEVRRQRLPAHRGVGEPPREEVHSRRHGRERGDHIPVEHHRGAREPVEVGRVDGRVPVRPQVVAAEGVRHYHHDIRASRHTSSHL